MKKLNQILRYAALMLIFFAAVILLVSDSQYIGVFLTTKVISFALFYLFGCVYTAWAKQGYFKVPEE